MENALVSIDNTISTNSSPRNNSPLRLNPPEYQNSLSQNNSPYSVHTCFNYIDIYRTNETINTINSLNKDINKNLKKSSMSN